MTADEHDRRRPGLNHLAFSVASRIHLNHLVKESKRHGWKPLFGDRYPHAGGPDSYAGYLTDEDGFEVELVAP